MMLSPNACPGLDPGSVNFGASCSSIQIIRRLHFAAGQFEVGGAGLAFIQSSGISGRKICAFGLNGVRLSDATAIDTVETLAPHFDLFAPCTWNNAKLRRAGFSEVLRQGLLSAGVKQDSISSFENECDAIQFALNTAFSGDLVAILGGVREHVLKEQIELYRAGLSARRA